MLVYNLQLTEEGREMLCAILDMWLEPFEDATKDVEQDRMFESAEELLEAIDGMHHQFHIVTTMREELQRMAHGSASAI